MNMELVELHNRPEYINACCNVLNNEWKRSHTARFHSLSKSSSNLPVSLVLLKPLQGRESQLIGHSKLCRVLHDDKACFVESVIVIPEERGKGYGKLIMKLTEEYARTKGFARCYLSTHDKERFYEAIGYAVCSPVCGISGTMDHMDRFLRLFDRNANGPPESRKALTDVCERKVASEESTDLPPPPPPPPVPPPSAKTKSVVPNKQAVRGISFGQQYTREQQDQILRVLNNSSEKELRKLAIGPSSVMRILHHREENSGFSSMEHVGAIDGIRGQGLAKICEAILYGRKLQEKRLPDRGSSIIPPLTRERMEDVSDIVAIDVSPPYLTWAHLTRENSVLALERVKFLDDKIRPHLYLYYNAVQQVLSQLPAASLYVVEQKQQRSGAHHKAGGSSEIALGQLTVQAMLVALLSHGKPLQPQVVSIKSSAITNIFDLNIGNERISGQETLKGLVDAGTLTFQGKLRSVYFKETPVNREHFCGVLLLARAYYMLTES